MAAYESQAGSVSGTQEVSMQVTPARPNTGTQEGLVTGTHVSTLDTQVVESAL